MVIAHYAGAFGGAKYIGFTVRFTGARLPNELGGGAVVVVVAHNGARGIPSIVPVHDGRPRRLPGAAGVPDGGRVKGPVRNDLRGGNARAQVDGELVLQRVGQRRKVAHRVGTRVAHDGVQCGSCVVVNDAGKGKESVLPYG